MLLFPGIPEPWQRHRMCSHMQNALACLSSQTNGEKQGQGMPRAWRQDIGGACTSLPSTVPLNIENLATWAPQRQESLAIPHLARVTWPPRMDPSRARNLGGWKDKDEMNVANGYNNMWNPAHALHFSYPDQAKAQVLFYHTLCLGLSYLIHSFSSIAHFFLPVDCDQYYPGSRDG